MSTLKVNKIRDTSGSTDAITFDPSGGAVLAGVTTISTARVTTGITTSIQVGGGVTISESGIEASGIGITCANINGAQIGGRRNIIINGAMKVAQRGTSFTSQSEYTMDRFKGERSTDGAATITQSTTAPDGFKNSLKYDITTADTSLSASQYAQITYRVEGQDLQLLAYGTSSAKTITLSFYVRSNKTGNYNLVFEQPDNGDNISSHQYTINSADTWERKVITTAGDTSGVINDDNGSGLAIKWGLAYGSYYSSGSVTNQWAAQNNANFGAGQDVNLFDSTSNEFYLTGVQLEVGSQATPFEHRSYQEELHLCKRYYQRYPEGPTADNYNCVPSGTMACNNTTTAYYCPTLNPTMRSDPTFSTSGNFRMNGTSSVNNIAVTSIGVYHNGASTPFQYATVASGLTAGQAVVLSANNDATAYIAYSAEL
jgi:hypothetical protein